jgi:anti-sigma factor RsiW
MSHSPCDDLDEYLDETLSESNRLRFDAHLLTCSDCQREIHFQRQVDSLLAAAAQLEPVPRSIVDRVERRILQEASRQRWFWTTGLAAAVMLVVTIGAWLGWRARHGPVVKSSAPDERHSTSVDAAQVQQTYPAAAADVKVGPTLEGIVVPMKSDDAKVAIFWIYPSNPQSSNQFLD